MVDAPLSAHDEQIADTMARTIWGEARGCGVIAMRGVACVILNRAAHPKWWGSDIVSCCTAPWQFSCWNRNDPNCALCEAVDTSNRWFVIALEIARQAAQGKLRDITNGADHYYALSMKKPPAWASRGTEVYRDGYHAFHQLETATKTNRPDVPNYSIRADLEARADDLNTAELCRIRQVAGS